MYLSLAILMSSPVFSAYPFQYIPSLPPQYCIVSKESLMPVSNFNDLSQPQLFISNISNIKEFLKKLDKDEVSSSAPNNRSRCLPEIYPHLT
ncbi:8725_t:CDS:2 [Funneliformis mosseae]|uniref:8725_t:CDS:1 n=1 Tax=Funneliformis mosseae TaxID=27381 RepID=A0A9N9C428_FUNMO|nr:8725_t:CDS:2 [Funneliformis mosseae]